MKRIASIATYHGRENSLKKTIESLRGQVDIIYVTANDEESCSHAVTFNDVIVFGGINEIDLTDNAKFFPLSKINEDCYFFTMDDDIEYAPDYIENMVKHIDKHECIITHHGRKFLGLGRKYYNEHAVFKCLTDNPHEQEIDVCGTGVTGFKTSYFKPMIWDSKDLKMSDLVFSLEAAKQEKKIMVIPHKVGHVKDIAEDDGIWGEFTGRTTGRQNQIADEIINIKQQIIMDKKQMQAELARRGIKFDEKASNTVLKGLLKDSVIVDPNPISTTIEDDITPIVIEGLTENVPTTEEITVIEAPLEAKVRIVTGITVNDAITKKEKIHFISPVVFNGKKYCFTTQNDNREVIEPFEYDTQLEADTKIKDILRNI